MPESPASSSRLKRNLLLLCIPAALSATVVYLLWQAHPDLEYWKQLIASIYAFIEAHPWALVLALAILPGMGFPCSPLLILVGVVLGPIYGLPLACLIAIIAQAICTIWTYLLAAGPLRDILTRYVLRKTEFPKLNESNALRLAQIVRITPGIPYPIQNIVLGVSGIKLKPYLLVSLPATGVWTIGFVFTGGAIFEGSAGLVITGFALLVVLILVTRALRNRTNRYAG